MIVADFGLGDRELGILTMADFPQIPLAVIFKREETGLGVAWLPNPVFDQVNRLCWHGPGFKDKPAGAHKHHGQPQPATPVASRSVLDFPTTTMAKQV